MHIVNKLRQNVGLETWISRQIVLSQTAHTKYKWPPYATEWTPMKIFFVRYWLQGWPTTQRPRATFVAVLQQRAISYTWGHMNPSLPNSHTYFCLARFNVNITHHQPDNDRTSQGIYCYACYLVGLLVYNYVRAAWNWVKNRMWLASRGWPPLC